MSKCYAYLVWDIVDTWEECEAKVKGVKAFYHKFASRGQAETWIKAKISDLGGKITPQVTPQVTPEVKSLYCDSGRPGDGITRIIICDEKGTSLYGNDTYKGRRCAVLGNYTNNQGEFKAFSIALKIALEKGYKIIKSDSELVVKYWLFGKGKVINSNRGMKKYQEETVLPRYKKFIANGGKVILISGDENLADLGDHK